MNGGKSEARPGPQPMQVDARPPLTFAVQRKCACGGAAGALTGQCDDCEGKKLQRSAAGPAPDAVPEIVNDVLATPGAPLGLTTRHDMESHFGHDFGSVRIHTDARAAESARSVGALAYTVGSHVVFGASRYAPATHAGRQLLAHELTHTIQQRGVVSLQRQAEPSVSAPTDASEVEADRVADQVAGSLLVEDDAQPAASQMRKTEFLDELQRSSCIAADEELARVGRSTEGCPFVERAFSRYRTMPAARVEQAIRRYVDPAGVTSARDYIPLVTRRVTEGVSRWAQTGDMSGVPPELAADAMGGGGGILGMLGGGLAGLVGGIGRMLFKRASSADATDEDLLHARAQLGDGAPLDTTVRHQMENAFGADFSTVRIHAGGRAGAASSQLAARAFTIGSDIAFAPGQYRPNTLVGDALIAHELAHVVQQSGGVQSKGTESNALDDDADLSAIGAVMSIWSSAKHVAANTIPRLRSGLQLQRCNQHRGYPASGGMVDAFVAPDRGGREYVELTYTGSRTATNRWLQFIWIEIIAETPTGEVRQEGTFGSSSAWRAMPLTTDPTRPRWYLDASEETEPFYRSRVEPGVGGASTLPMRDRPEAFDVAGTEIFTRTPEATEARVVMHFDTYLMENASITGTSPTTTRPNATGRAVYHVQWTATTPFRKTATGGSERRAREYRIGEGGRVTGLPTPMIELLNLLYGEDGHSLR